ncbi:MAG TPA: class I SAM-dependent methyltransferase [candidate division Zixibacteria bacterium]|nr:class I SAM-dependent methyltransferase [candidate division Zixibacteria bacterium]
MSYHYLSYLAELGTADIHPMRHRATQALIEVLDIRAGHHVLDIGCGTGNTAILVSKLTEVEVIGIDVLPVMLSAARKRVSWAGEMDHVRILRASGNHLPFSDNSFDRIYAESVLGFQKTDIAEDMLAEIFRALKPGGLFAANDAIWMQGVSQAIVETIHDESLDDFGLSPASRQAWSLEQWLYVMQQAGFTVISAELLESAVAASAISPSRRILLRLRLGTFSAFYRSKRHWSPRLCRAKRTYDERVRKHRLDGQYIEGRIFVLQKMVTEDEGSQPQR